MTLTLHEDICSAALESSELESVPGLAVVHASQHAVAGFMIAHAERFCGEFAGCRFGVSKAKGGHQHLCK